MAERRRDGGADWGHYEREDTQAAFEPVRAYLLKHFKKVRTTHCTIIPFLVRAHITLS